MHTETLRNTTEHFKVSTQTDLRGKNLKQVKRNRKKRGEKMLKLKLFEGERKIVNKHTHRITARSKERRELRFSYALRSLGRWLCLSRSAYRVLDHSDRFSLAKIYSKIRELKNRKNDHWNVSDRRNIPWVTQTRRFFGCFQGFGQVFYISEKIFQNKLKNLFRRSLLDSVRSEKVWFWRCFIEVFESWIRCFRILRFS